MKHKTYGYDLAAFGRRLKNAIEDKGMSQLEFAARAEISQPSVSAYIAGSRKMTIAMLYNICQVLDVSASDLLGF